MSLLSTIDLRRALILVNTGGESPLRYTPAVSCVKHVEATVNASFPLHGPAPFQGAWPARLNSAAIRTSRLPRLFDRGSYGAFASLRMNFNLPRIPSIDRRPIPPVSPPGGYKSQCWRI